LPAADLIASNNIHVYWVDVNLNVVGTIMMNFVFIYMYIFFNATTLLYERCFFCASIIISKDLLNYQLLVSVIKDMKDWELMWSNILWLIDLTDRWLGQSLILING
jgi:hypothetical protein